MNTAFDPSQLTVAVNGGLAEVNRLEAVNIAAAVGRHLFTPPADFDLSFLLRLHRDMFGEVWQWAGVPRRIDLNFGVPWPHVEAKLFDTTLDLPYWAAQPLDEQCARLHHRLAAIHPFVNGNGRWSRLAADIWAVKSGGNPVRWPTAFVGTTSPVRDEYIAAMRAADANDLGPLSPNTGGMPARRYRNFAPIRRPAGRIPVRAEFRCRPPPAATQLRPPHPSGARP